MGMSLGDEDWIERGRAGAEGCVMIDDETC